jgi:cupin fold WbuC family metalloprotein
MENIEKIMDEGEIIAVVVRKKAKLKGVNFFTPLDFSQQLGLLVHEKGKIIKAHKHKHIKREIFLTQEVLVVLEGKVKIDLYNEKHQKIKSIIITPGDTILLASGAHSIEIMKDSKIIEVKQGPYAGVDDKEFI